MEILAKMEASAERCLLQTAEVLALDARDTDFLRMAMRTYAELRFIIDLRARGPIVGTDIFRASGEARTRGVPLR
jgi:hypothetical protein